MIGPLTTTQAGAWCLMLAGLLGMAAMVRWYRPARPVFAASVLVVLVALLAGCGPAGGRPPSTDGRYAVGTEVSYGTYRTTAKTCRWVVGGDRPRAGRGPDTVYLSEHDAWISVQNCGVWYEVNR